MCELPLEKREGKLQEGSNPQAGEEQQSQPCLPAMKGRQEPKELCRDSQMLKVTLGQVDRPSVLSLHSPSRGGWFPFSRACNRVTE